MATKRLIDANALKERAIRVSTVKEHTYMKAVGTHEIDKAPTVDAVEVVRCKDCKHWERCPYQEYYGVCTRVDYDPPVTHSVDFCSYGERKDNGC